MTVGSLFAGIGGFDLGLERAGFTIKWQVENDPYCTRVLAKHWPRVKRYGDIRGVDWRHMEPVDLLCGGFPCQPFSCAGQRRGTDDDRYLWPDMRLAVLHCQPTWVLAENVPGLVGPALDTVLSDLEAAGYEVGTLAVPACAVNAPHIRQRLWILAHRTSARGQQQSRGRYGQAGTLRREEHDGRPASQTHELASAGQGYRARYVADAKIRGLEGCRDESYSNCERSGQKQFVGSCIPNDRRWAAEPDVGRVAHGVPHRVDRLRGLGNAIVPQIAEWLGRRIMEQA